MSDNRDPMIQRRLLRMELRRAREAAGLNQRDVVPHMDWSLTKLIRIESGQVTISLNDLRALLTLYGVVDEARVNELLAMAKAAREPAWWASYSSAKLISPEFTAFLSYEQSATIIRNFESILVPGLLQTEEYARATLAQMASSVASPVEQEKVDSLVDLRMVRQERLWQRDDRPQMFFAIDESVLRRWVGGPDVMRRQLLRLKEQLLDPEIVIWIVPFQFGLYELMRAPYVLFELPATDGSEDVLYLENTRGEMIIRDDHLDASAYLNSFWRIESFALKDEVAVALVDNALRVIPE